MMLGFDITPVMMICWAIVTPLCTSVSLRSVCTHLCAPVVCFLSQVLLVLCFVSIKSLKYNKTYLYPEWSILLGWSIGLSGVVMIPIVALYKFLTAEGATPYEVKLAKTEAVMYECMM